MNVYVNKITGIEDAITAMYFSKRSWTRAKEDEIRHECYWALSESNGRYDERYAIVGGNFQKWMDTLCKWGRVHPTLLRFIDISVTVEGLHRGGQDDWDSHAKRFDNRIIRASTRLADFKDGEMSDYYKGKILTTDMALTALGITTPDEIEYEGRVYVRGVNGYILKGMEDNRDVKRGLYMLSIPSTFIFKINLTEWSHVYKERNIHGTAHPEVKECCEAIADQLEQMHKQFTRDLWDAIPN